MNNNKYELEITDRFFALDLGFGTILYLNRLTHKPVGFKVNQEIGVVKDAVGWLEILQRHSDVEQKILDSSTHLVYTYFGRSYLSFPCRVETGTVWGFPKTIKVTLGNVALFYNPNEPHYLEKIYFVDDNLTVLPSIMAMAKIDTCLRGGI